MSLFFCTHFYRSSLVFVFSVFIFSPTDVFSNNTHVKTTQALIESHEFDKAVARAADSRSHYLSVLIDQANLLDLSSHPVWQTLMHYKKGFFYDHVSQVDGANYFVSSEGKTNPMAELRATLASFFSASKIKNTDFLYQCLFPARYYWLNQQLNFSKEKLTKQTCENFDYFAQALDADALTIVFPSSHPNSPSSMFGHTLLRFDRAGQTKKDRMLAYTANYAAEDNSASDLAYAYRGLTGGFVGRFSIIPYYMKLREYAQMENRDLWEYQLNLDKSDVDFIVMHAYELKFTYFDYYFFTENCSYHLLSLIEIVMPELRLTDQFNGPVVPIDTIKLLQEHNLISSKAYFPSSRLTIAEQRDLMPKKQYSIALHISKELSSLKSKELTKYSNQQQAEILDLAYDLNRFKQIRSSGVLEAKINNAQRKLLIARSLLKVKTLPVKDSEYDVTPDEGHDTARVSLGAGVYNGSEYVALGYRLAYHDVLDPTQGYALNYQIQFLNTEFRYFPSSSEFKLNRLDIIDILSLEPQDDFFKNISWRINTGVYSLESENSQAKFVYTLNGGPGLTYALDFLNNGFVYGFFESEVNYSRIYNHQFQAFAGFSIGFLASVSKRWNVHLTAKIVTNVIDRDEKINRSAFAVAQSYRVEKDVAVYAKISQTENLVGQQLNGVVGINYYF
ncbi:MAG: DUF4105 domain-containing protein [Proteobacteria bacterium]|nr:DUF4105 domain-containing protein [Pseudomonadota bacterium]